MVHSSPFCGYVLLGVFLVIGLYIAFLDLLLETRGNTLKFGGFY